MRSLSLTNKFYILWVIADYLAMPRVLVRTIKGNCSTILLIERMNTYLDPSLSTFSTDLSGELGPKNVRVYAGFFSSSASASSSFVCVYYSV